MTIKDFNDIQREREQREREQAKNKIATDTAEIFKKITEKMKENREKSRPKRSKMLRWIIYPSLAIIVLLFLLNLILLNLWVLRWVIKSLLGL